MKRALSLITSPPLLLAIITVSAYGLLSSQLGFYWDDLPMSWIRYSLGQEAFTQYFSTNRPAWGIWYGFLTNFIPQTPLPWQLIALFWRWLSSLAFWGILRQLFPNQKKLALSASLLFLLYPGFNQQPVSFVYGYHFTVYTLFLFSLFSMLWTLRHPRHAALITTLGMIAAALNLMMGEYFFVLDLIRPLLLWYALAELSAPKERIRRAFSAWLPYLVIFIAGVLGRSLVFNNQVYSYSLLDNLKAAPLPALWTLTQTIALSLWTTLVSAWGEAFVLPDFALQGKVTITLYLGIIVSLFALVFFALSKQENKNNDVIASRRPSATQSTSTWREIASAIMLPRNDSIPLIILGIFAMLLAGIPFWLTNLPVTLGFPANRATLPFIFGSVLVLAGILSFIPRKSLQTILLTLLIAFATGRQFLSADEFRRDWRVQKNLFWQLSWRIPALEEDTAILLNEGALKFYADNSLSAPLNWVYAPNATAEHIPYMLFYPRSRFGLDGAGLQANLALHHDFIAGKFNGSSNQMVLVNFDPPGCLHVVDPELDEKNKFIANLLIRENASFSHPELVLQNGVPVMPAIYGAEPQHGWCYYYEKADLASQFGAWDEVARLGAQAFNAGDYPNNPTEYFPFIEGYALTGDWAQAEQLSTRAYRVSPVYMRPLLCPLWERLVEKTPEHPDKGAILTRLKTGFGCN